MDMEHRQQSTETFHRPLEGPGSEERLRGLKVRFRAISARAEKRMPGWRYWLLVIVVFVISGSAVLVW